MTQDIKNKELQERQAYVPGSVKVIKVTLHGILCQSGLENLKDITEMEEGDDNW